MDINIKHIIMNTSIVTNRIKRFINSFPEIWYITLFSLLVISDIACLFTSGWHSRNTVTTLVSLAIVILLLMQLFRNNTWSRFLLGTIFTFGSLFMFLALLSEYSEFPLGTEPGAITLLAVGIPLIGFSFLMGGKMLLKGIHNMYAC